MPPAVAVWQFVQIKQHIVENVLETIPLTSAEMDAALNQVAIHNNIIKPGATLGPITSSRLRKRLNAAIELQVEVLKEQVQEQKKITKDLTAANKRLRAELDTQNKQATANTAAAKEAKHWT